MKKYGDFLDAWLSYYERPVLKARSFEKYERIVYKYIKPALGAIAVNRLQEENLHKFLTELEKKGLSASSLNSIATVLRLSLKKAEETGHRLRFSLPVLHFLKKDVKECTVFSEEEQRRIEGYILINKKVTLYGVIFCLYTGLRIGEMLALRWEDVRLDEREIFVRFTARDSWENGSYHKIRESPKSESSRRYLPIPSALLPFLTEWKKAGHGEYAVFGRGEEGVSIRSYQKRFSLLLEKLSISHRGFHALRHTFATRSLECGMDIKTLSEILGHKSPRVTMERYAHTRSAHKQAMMDRIGAEFLFEV